jgi:hypothetical protein
MLLVIRRYEPGRQGAGHEVDDIVVDRRVPGRVSPLLEHRVSLGRESDSPRTAVTLGRATAFVRCASYAT